MEEIRSLEEICDGETFSIKLLGNTYCKLSLSNETKCDWKSKIKDKNNLYPCLKGNPKIDDSYLN